MSQPHAANGRGAAYARPGISGSSVCLEPEPSRVAEPKLSNVLTESLRSGRPKTRSDSERFTLVRPSEKGVRHEIRNPPPASLHRNYSPAFMPASRAVPDLLL